VRDLAVCFCIRWRPLSDSSVPAARSLVVESVLVKH
jgi:hypothetical protein